MTPVLLVHCLGRTPASMFPLGPAVRRAGGVPHFFGYSATLEPFPRIVQRLVKVLGRVRPAVVVAHSLGAILLRLALPGVTHLPRHLVMLGPPNRPPRLAARFWKWLPFRLFAGTAGRFLAHPAGYASLPVPTVPTTVIAGTAGPVGRFSPFGAEPNDGVVSLGETELPGAEVLLVNGWHTWLMAHPRVKGRVAAVISSCRADRPAAGAGRA